MARACLTERRRRPFSKAETTCLAPSYRRVKWPSKPLGSALFPRPTLFNSITQVRSLSLDVRPFGPSR
jgi:hypothetical protein